MKRAINLVQPLEGWVRVIPVSAYEIDATHVCRIDVRIRSASRLALALRAKSDQYREPRHFLGLYAGFPVGSKVKLADLP